MPRAKPYFPKRIPEPKRMGKLEFKIFEELSKQNYKRCLPDPSEWLVRADGEAGIVPLVELDLTLKFV